MGVSYFSANGKLGSMYKPHSVTEEERTFNYQQVRIGEPLQVRYLRFLLHHEKAELNKDEQVMVSTFIKNKETKQAGAEAINLFDPQARFSKDKTLSISDFGAQNYGHPLCYYTKSYLGESLYFTAKIMELDKVDRNLIDAIQKGVGSVASLPAFTAFLPYAAGFSIGVKLFEELVNLFDKDDPIIGRHNLDLYFDSQNSPRLQSGRIVCIDGVDDSFPEDNYELTTENILVDCQTKKEYTDTSYFVLQVDAKQNECLESFDYFLGAAELFQKTNRSGNPIELVNSVTSLCQSYNDVKAISKINSLNPNDEKDKEIIDALYKSMSPEVQRFIKDKVSEPATVS